MLVITVLEWKSKSDKNFEKKYDEEEKKNLRLRENHRRIKI